MKIRIAWAVDDLGHYNAVGWSSGEGGDTHCADTTEVMDPLGGHIVAKGYAEFEVDIPEPPVAQLTNVEIVDEK